MEKIFKVGTRTSPLAARQVKEIENALRAFYPKLKIKAVGIDTYGDKDKVTPISEVEGSDFFTREIDEALLRGKIDFAVHSAKDLPNKIMDGLVVAALTESLDPFDALVSRNGLKLEELPVGAAVGTSSLRRKEGLKKIRDDFNIVDIRGNIEERLQLLGSGLRHRVDAVVIAACALIRLGLEHKITQRIPFEIITPHPLQGVLAVTARADEAEIISMCSVLDRKSTGEAYAWKK